MRGGRGLGMLSPAGDESASGCPKIQDRPWILIFRVIQKVLRFINND